MKTEKSKRIIISLFAIASLTTVCCNHAKNGTSIVASNAVLIDTAAGSCPSLTKDANGNIVLSWVRNINDSSSIVCYAVSLDMGKTFGRAITVPQSKNVQPHGENMPKLIFKPSGEIIAVWGEHHAATKNAYAGSVYYSQSFDKGASWGKAKQLVKDTASYDQRYFDLALLPGGEAAIVWLDNRKTRNMEGSAIYFACTNGSNGFENEKRISEPCCECCRTNLFVDARQDIHVLYRAIINDSIRDMVHTVSADGGRSFSQPRRINIDNWVINGCPHTGPSMTENSTGLHFAWYTLGNARGLYYCHSRDNGINFSLKDSIRTTSAARHPQIKTLKNGELVIAWDEAIHVGDHLNNRIGIQERSGEGKNEVTQFITPDTCLATFPVIFPVGEHAAVLAYSQTADKKDYVMYRTVTLNRF